MEKELTIDGEIIIDAPVAKVWDALTKPEWTRQYMFGCDVISDWKPGSPVLWKGSWEGNDMIFVKGFAVNVQPGKLIQYTVFDPNSSLKDIPENYLTVTYILSNEDGHTKLVVSQGDFSKVGEGERRYKESMDGGGWDNLLPKIKEVIEKQAD